MTTPYDHEVFALREQLDWQPIATAPKDGRRLLAVYPGSRVRVTWWDDIYKTWASFVITPPTHWRPLPDPPKVTP